jgi:hypothetical protein
MQSELRRYHVTGSYYWRLSGPLMRYQRYAIKPTHRMLAVIMRALSTSHLRESSGESPIDFWFASGAAHSMGPGPLGTRTLRNRNMKQRGIIHPFHFASSIVETPSLFPPVHRSCAGMSVSSTSENENSFTRTRRTTLGPESNPPPIT